MNDLKLRFHLILLPVALLIGLATVRSYSQGNGERRSYPSINGERLMEHMTAMAAIGKIQAAATAAWRTPKPTVKPENM